MRRNYHTIDKQGKAGERKLTDFLVRNGQALLQMMELIEHSRMDIDELIDVVRGALIGHVLELSAAQIAGPPQQGKARAADLVWHGTQPGRVCLKERKLRVNRAAIAEQGSRREQRSSRPGLPGHAEKRCHGPAHAGNSDERRLHAALRQSDS